MKGVVVPQNDGMDNRIYVSTIQTNLMTYGFMLSQDSFDEMSKSDLSFLVSFNDEVINYLKYITGGLHNYKPFYENFPNEVLSINDEELLLNSIKHYFSNGEWLPPTKKLEKKIKIEHVNFNIINLSDDKNFKNIFTNLVSLNTSLTPKDVEIIKWFTKNESDLIFPSTIPFKENLCLLYSMGINNLPIKNVTDVLRIAVYMSGGDISLPKVSKIKYFKDSFKFKRFTRKERRDILQLLENTNCNVGEMSLKRERWLRLGESIHPFEYKKQYPKAANLFNLLRNTKVQSWYGLLNDSFEISFEEGLKVLSERPGEFARRIDFLVRNNIDKIDLIFKYFNICVENVSNKVLFEIYTHFEKRTKTNVRSILVKNSRKKQYLKELEPLNNDIVEKINSKVIEILKNKFSKLENLGDCWIDEELKKIPLPTNMRNLNLSLKPMIRGQRTPINNKNSKVIRGYVHWFDKNGTEDLDLGCMFIGNNNHKPLNYTSLKIGKSVHSGDVRHVRGHCAEYVDIDIKNALELGFKYVIMDVRNYNNKPLKSLDCKFGFMGREFPKRNKTWYPETIENSQDLNSDNISTIICIFDLEKLEYIYLDLDSNSNVTNNDLNNLLNLINEYSELPKFSVYDLILLHVESRGKQVTLNDNVTNYFKFEDYTSSYEKIGQLMGI